MSKVNVYELRKNIVTFKDGDWKWKDFSLKAICNSDVYGTQKIRLFDKTATIKQAVEHYQKLVDREKWSSAKVLKEAIWNKLDTVSRQRIKGYYDDPEVRIASINKPIVEDDTIIAYFELEDSYYNGEQTEIPINYKELIVCSTKLKRGFWQDNKRNIKYIPEFAKPGEFYILEKEETIFHPKGSIYNHHGIYEEDHGGIATNSEVTFSDFMHTHPSYYWLPQAITIAKQFGIEPKWRTFIQGNTRGIGLTAHDARELQQVANWYSGLADADKEDFSDKIWLHHEDGVQSIQISEREYRTNPEKWQDWKETENRDFRCSLHEDETEDGEQD